MPIFEKTTNFVPNLKFLFKLELDFLRVCIHFACVNVFCVPRSRMIVALFMRLRESNNVRIKHGGWLAIEASDYGIIRINATQFQF